jgi:hypothetical protein
LDAGIFKSFMGARNRPARLHSLSELVPWNRFLGLKIRALVWQTPPLALTILLPVSIKSTFKYQGLFAKKVVSKKISHRRQSINRYVLKFTGK